MPFLFKLIGAVGLILIAIGVITKQRKTQDKYYLVGGLFLIAYSIYIKDVVFIILQIIFLIAAGYDLVTVGKESILRINNPRRNNLNSKSKNK